MPPQAPNTCAPCKCHHHWVRPTAVVLIGVAFLLNALNVLTWNVVAIAWPILLIIWGAAKFCKCCKGCGCACGDKK